MKYSAKVIDLETHKSDCLVATVAAKGTLSAAAGELDRLGEGYIARITKRGDFDGDTASTLLLPETRGIAAGRILLAGSGKDDAPDAGTIARIVDAVVKRATSTSIRDLTLLIDGLVTEPGDLHQLIRHTIHAAEAAVYRCDKLKSEKKKAPALKRIVFAAADNAQLKNIRAAIGEAAAIAQGTELARNVANLPGNVCTPTYLASQARSMAKAYPKLKATVLGEKDMEKLGMGSLLSVSRGSREPAKLIVLEYKNGPARQKPVVFVGKGLTFDAGGISLKPSAAMDEMKYDMCGGASVLGTMKACAEMGLRINAVGVIPASENLPDGAANKPGDIVTSMSGQTIEILNTDAEGRLILCDALTYSERFKPEIVIDIATLTGACVVALGSHASGLLSDDDELVGEILEAGDYTHDRAWRLPLWSDYQKQLDSNFADMANIGGREAGTITAACFLSRYTKNFRWAHLDIAGTAWRGGKAKGATGRPVPLLTQILINRASKK